jgi:hypothetical protein
MRLLRRFWSTDRSLSLLLVSLILVIFVIQPLQAAGVVGRLLIALFFSFILISGVAAVAKNALTTAVVGGVVIISLVVRWLRLGYGGKVLMISDTFVSSLFCAILAVVVLAQVFRKGPITWYRIQGAVAFYLLLGLAWAGAYELIELRWPDAFVPASLATMNQSRGLSRCTCKTAILAGVLTRFMTLKRLRALIRGDWLRAQAAAKESAPRERA